MTTEIAILDAAYALYVREGVEGVSMRRVASGLGITATALYRHYHGKDGLIAAIAERGFADFSTALSRPPVAASPERRVLQILDRYRVFAFRQPELFRLMFGMPRPGARRFPRDFEAHRSRVFDDLRTAVAGAMAKGVFPKGSSLEAALALWAQAHGLITLYQAGRFTHRPREFAALYRRLLAGTWRKTR